MQGGDVIAKSRTGSGKTLAFLIPAIEMVVHTLKNKDSSEKRGKKKKQKNKEKKTKWKRKKVEEKEGMKRGELINNIGVYVLIIVPTHELAMQTFTQARKLLRDHQYITVGVSMGGAELSNEIELFAKHPRILFILIYNI